MNDAPGRGLTLEDLPDRSIAIYRGFMPIKTRAIAFGFLATSGFAVILAVLLDGRLYGLATPLLAGGLGAIAGLGSARLTFPGRFLRAWEAFSWLGRREMDQFVARSGGPVPASPAAMTAWLASQPATPATRPARCEFLAMLGRFDEARAEFATIESVDPADRLEVVALRQYMDWLETGSVELDALRTEVGSNATGTDLRLAGDVMLAMAEARARRMARDRDWYAPLATARRALGRSAQSVVWRDTWAPLLPLYLGLGVLVSSVVSLLLVLL